MLGLCFNGEDNIIMAIKGKQKLKILYLMRMFMEKSDEDHGITINQMIEELARYDIIAERKSIYDDLEILQTFGLDLMKEKGKLTKYYLVSRTFELPELKLLVDAVECSRFVTTKKSRELISKISSLASKPQAQLLQRQVFVANRAKSLNESIYYNVDTLHTAISMNKKVSFQYFDYDINKEKVFRKQGEFYHVSPYVLLWDDENYYLIVYYEKYESFVHYRVDRMFGIEILEENRESLKEDMVFNPGEYSKKTFNMYGGEEEVVVLEFKNELVNQVLDRFGSEITLQVTSNESFSIRTTVKISQTFYSWLFQFGEKVKILEPESVRREYIQRLKDVFESAKKGILTNVGIMGDV